MAFGTALAMPSLSHHHRTFDRDDDDSNTEPFPQVPSIEIMSATSSPTASSFRRQARDTGFPEPFNNDRNTTLPYPGADLSPNARITMGESLLNTDSFSSSKRSSRRSRLSRHKRTVSYGRITPQFEAMQSVMSIVDATTSPNTSGSRPDTGTAPTNADAGVTAPATGPAASRVPATPVSASFSSVRTSRDEERSSWGSKRGEDTPPSSPESRTSSRKSGFLRRWRSKRE